MTTREQDSCEGQRRMSKKLFTIGYGGHQPDELLAILTKNHISNVIDVRLRPDRSSMGVYVKAKSADKGIERLLTSQGIRYHSFPELGNVFLDYEDWRERYKSLLTRAGELLLTRLHKVPRPFCLLCAEKRADDCHRKLIADYLGAEGWDIQHLE